MFSRRHPFLFSCLVFSGIAGVTLLGMTLLITTLTHHTDRVSGEKVGVIEISGVITHARDVLTQIRKFREDDHIRAIVVRINSPGGAVGPSQEIYREIRKTIPVKKVVASLGAVAASGGYYVASAADGIVADPGTITGSIGVIMSYTNLRALMDKIGLTPVVIKSGTYKDIGSPMRKMTPEERKLLENLADDIHRQFIRDVAAGRHKDVQAVTTLADGRIFTGETFQSLGMVDRLGNLEDAIDWAGKLGGIKGKVEAVYPEKSRFGWVEFLRSEIHDLTTRVLSQDLFAGALYRPGN